MVLIHTLVLRKPKISVIVMSFLLLSLPFILAGLEYWEDMQFATIPSQNLNPPTGPITIIIKIPDLVLQLYSAGNLYKTYPIAVGKDETPTPVGDWTIVWKSYRKGDMFGTRFLALSVPWGGYGIHGTNQPWSIGTVASHGCIRMRNRDVEELYEWVPVGTSVRVEDQVFSIERTLSYEISGTDVVILQRKLRELGYFEGQADGFFDRNTEVAVKRYQYDNGLNPTGIADKKTIKKLDL